MGVGTDSAIQLKSCSSQSPYFEEYNVNFAFVSINADNTWLRCDVLIQKRAYDKHSVGKERSCLVATAHL